MQLTNFDFYLIVINILGFFFYLLNSWLYNHTESKQIDKVLTIVSFLGGSLGLVIAILIFDRKAVKDNMMSRVFVSCMLVIQIVIFLVAKGYIKSQLTFAFWNYFRTHRKLLIYLGVINVVAFVMFGIDKWAAITDRSRIRIVTLLGIAFIGGSVGALLAMYLFHHKTHKDYFTTGIPLIIIMQIVLLFFLMNGSFSL